MQTLDLRLFYAVNLSLCSLRHIGRSKSPRLNFGQLRASFQNTTILIPSRNAYR
jgi:hypothetical protein